jgi:signal transduction histidine kinase/ligand-binding sensor domain-containing protein
MPNSPAVTTSRRFHRPARLLLWAIGLAALLPTHPALALDPARALTQYVHRIWQMQQGLPEGTIYSICQTSDGFLWLGTQSGLVRFDGVQFTTVRDVGGTSLENLWIRDLLPDREDGLWLATDDAGLIHIQDGVARSFTTRDGLPSNKMHALLLDRHGTLWVAGDGGLVSVIDGKVTRYATEHGMLLRKPRDVCESADGRIWVGGDARDLEAWNGTAFERHPLASLPAGATVRALAGTADGAVWAGTTHGLVCLKDGGERRYTRADGLPDEGIDCIVAGQDGCIYAGTKNGFCRVRNGEVESFGTAQGLSQSAVFALCYDREGSVWIGTKHGLNQVMDRRTLPFTTSEGLPSNNTGPVLTDKEGKTWVGTLDAGLSRFDGKHFTVIDDRQGLSSNTVYALSTDEGNGLWVGTARGLDHLRDGRVDAVYTTAQGLESDAILCLQRDAQGVLWAGTRKGLARFVDGHFVESPVAGHEPLTAAVVALGQHRGRLVVATDNGNLYTCNGAGQLQPLVEGLSAQGVVDAFYEDPDGLLWLGSQGGGLYVLDGGKTFRYSIRDGLYDDDLYGIVGDRKGNLWIGCSKGIFSVSRADLRNFAAGEIKTLKCNPFSPLEALRTIECKPGVQPAVCEARDGMAWFSTIHGVLALDTDNAMRKLLPAPVVIDDVIVNGQSRHPARLTALPPGDANLEFRYAALSYVVPARITFQYRLEGFDPDWVEAGTRREAFYTNLRPGSYRFRVMAKNVDNSWSECASPVAFTITPYFYQRAWFLPLCGVSLLFAAWMIYRQRVSRIRQRLDVVLTERSRIARELHDTLMQGFSGITMEMQALSARLPDIPERGELNGIIADAGTCLREARQSIAGLRTTRDERSGLAASIAQHAKQMTEAKDVRLRLKLDGNPQGLPPAVEYNLLRIAQEAVANSVKHAAARTIEVCLSSSPQEVLLSVKDDGTGLKDGNGNGRPGHYGLIGMRERAAQIGADLRIDSEPGRGTSVSVLLPIGNHHHHGKKDNGNVS